jgi:formate C-acetyltransferase
MATETVVSPDRALTYEDRVRALIETKQRHTTEKRRVYKSLDTDDHGSILMPEPVTFTPKSNHENGGSYGAKTIGENFGALLSILPAYVDPMSSLLGAWFVDRPAYRVGAHWPPDPEMDYSHLHEAQARYSIISGIGGGQHFCPDLTIGFKLGWGGILQSIRDYAKNPPLDADPGFYEGHEATVLGIQAWMRRHVEKARAMSETESHPQLRQNLCDMADMNERLITEPPTSFRDACQWISWVATVTRMFNGAGGIGQLDELLQPFYERDIALGRLDDEEAIFHLIATFIIDTQYYQIGGPDPAGKDRTNCVSFLILEAAHRMKGTSNITVRVWDGLDPALFDTAVRNLFADRNGSPRFIGEKGMTEGFMNNGYARELARQRVTSGCHWVGIPGREYTLNDIVKINFAAVFDAALREMVGDPNVENSVDELWRHYEKHLRLGIACVKEGIDWHLRHMYKVVPELPLNLLCHGPIERGRDITDGGVDYYNMCIDGAGLATVADSFAAIAIRVEREKRLTWDALMEALDTDFKNAEAVRLMLRSIPRFGSGGSLADEYARRLTALFEEVVKESPTPDGFNCIPGLFSWANTIGLGRVVGATPNGRHAYAPISHGANPDPGFKHAGAATALLQSVASVQCHYGNTVPVQVEFDPGIARDADGAEILKALIRAYCDMGGTLMNINILNKQQVLEAHEDPERYPDLVVRVTGFSAYFRMLSKEFRQLVVDRIIAEEMG